MKLIKLSRYVGSKSKLSNKYPINRLGTLDSYCEPFAGSLGLFTRLVNTGIINSSTKVTINDLNNDLINSYLTLRDFSPFFNRVSLKNLEIEVTPDKNHYLKILKNYNENLYSGSDRGLVYLYLLRNSFSGMSKRTKGGKLSMGLGHALKTQWQDGFFEGWHYWLQNSEITSENYSQVKTDSQLTFVDPPYSDSKFNYQMENKLGFANRVDYGAQKFFLTHCNNEMWLSGRGQPYFTNCFTEIINVQSYYNLGRKEHSKVNEYLAIKRSL